MKNESRPRLVLIPGGAGIEGPIRRLNLSGRFPYTPPLVTACLILSKVVLLASLWYWLYR